jgi:hypothetical protein
MHHEAPRIQPLQRTNGRFCEHQTRLTLRARASDDATDAVQRGSKMLELAIDMSVGVVTDALQRQVLHAPLLPLLTADAHANRR